jgi:hypothetical protein
VLPLQSEARRSLLASLVKTAPLVLRFLEQSVEQSVPIAAAAAPGAGGDRAAGAAAAGAIHSALGAAATYAEWAPVGILLESGVVAACAYLLGVPDFREGGCTVLRQLAGELKSMQGRGGGGGGL